MNLSARKKIFLDILRSFYAKLSQIESRERKLEAQIQAETDQAKAEKIKNQLKNL